MIDDLCEAVIAAFARLTPYGADADPRLRGASYSDDARLSAATSIACAAIDHAQQPTPDETGAKDQIDDEQEQA